MGILAWIILGLIAGAIAKAIMPGRDPGGFIVTALIGIVGAVIGGFLGNMIFGIGGVSGIDIRSILISVVGALVLLWIYRMATAARRCNEPAGGVPGLRPRGAPTARGARRGSFRIGTPSPRAASHSAVRSRPGPIRVFSVRFRP
jgi:uncharacterized membrane protein YeaQ/YmgE (transglycosylase-associated protein family)